MQDKELRKRTKVTKEKKQDAYQVAETVKELKKEPEFEEKRRIASQQKSQAFKSMSREDYYRKMERERSPPVGAYKTVDK
jgi:hypothetical protein